MKRLAVLLIMGAVLLPLIFAPAVFGEIRKGSSSVSPLAGAWIFEGNQPYRPGSTFGLGMAHNFTEVFGLEAMFNFIRTDTDTLDQDIDAFAYQLNAILHLRPSKKFVPYFSFGYGGISIVPSRDEQVSQSFFSGGVGFKYFFDDNLAFRVDVKENYMMDAGHSNVSVMVGLTFHLGGKSKTVKKAVPVKRTINPDTDGDGVLNNKDICPYTPAGDKVDKDGCSIIPKKPRKAKKAKKAKKAEVVKQVQQSKTITLRVEFDVNSDSIKGVHSADLKELADFMKEFPDTKTVIEGHTDSTGAAAYNLDLSKRRAASVMNYLIRNYNISASRLKSKGHGESVPVADNGTAFGRQKNRRVVAIISN